MKRGFTLLEILVTIAIFSVLVTISGFVYSSALSRSRDHQRISDLQTINNGLEQYYLDHKSYPSIGADPGLFLAKFQLEPYGNCLPSTHGFLVPTYIAAIPEDPQVKFVPTGIGGCQAQSQARQYIYVPLVLTAATIPVQDFFLAAKVERASNVSADLPWKTGAGGYKNLVSGAGITLCRNTTNPNCTHNYFTGPKKNQ